MILALAIGGILAVQTLLFSDLSASLRTLEENPKCLGLWGAGQLSSCALGFLHQPGLCTLLAGERGVLQGTYMNGKVQVGGWVLLKHEEQRGDRAHLLPGLLWGRWSTDPGSWPEWQGSGQHFSADNDRIFPSADRRASSKGISEAKDDTR